MSSRQSSSRRDGRRRGGTKFSKFTNSDTPPVRGDNRPRDAYDGDYERTWNYTPRSHGIEQRDVRSPWHLPPNHDVPRDVRDRSRSLGRIEALVETDRRSLPSISRQDDYANEYRRSHREEEHLIKSPEFVNLPNLGLKPLKEISEFPLDTPLQDGQPIASSHPLISNEPEPVTEDEPLIMVIIYEGNPNYKFDNKKVSSIQKKLMKKLMAAIQDGTGTGVQFEAHTYDGKYLKFTCANRETCDWLKSAVSSIEKLTIMLEKDLQSYVGVTTFIPSMELDQETCQRALTVQNPHLCINKWKIWAFIEDTEHGGYIATFGVPKKYISKIEKAKGKAYYMFSTIKLDREEDKNQDENGG